MCNEQEREKAKALERRKQPWRWPWKSGLGEAREAREAALEMAGACTSYYVITIMATRLFNPYAAIITIILGPT